ncbi:alpha/beta fold hydrolase [Limibacillus halophilus]|uniref:Pimeloyl-ACP methyl ester carboxylesterase n=1 Tax=Limibacillus halophilus TaxID=1579333 RepID=A0A839SQQ1_9PROT|nr:alpha/beta hydrolase [Limibacillus halophilus]MBB3064279.1 pimeloyl-ACP methyl ester carboxylesterase [Limibacillus halophilus]
MSQVILNETETFTATMDDGAGITVRRWGKVRAERFIISHGNGLAVDAFKDFGLDLSRDFEVVAFDMRNHGSNATRIGNEDNWARFIKDFPQILAAIDSEFGVKPTHGAFHSLSSLTCLYSQAEIRYPWRSLTLFEPPATPPADSGLQEVMLSYHVELANRTRARRQIFDNPEQLAASMRRSPAFARISDDSILRLARATLRADGATWRLACPAEFEAATYEIASNIARWPGLARIDVPVRIVLGEREDHSSPILVEIGELLAKTFGFDSQVLPGTTHFMQLEKPAHCAELARNFASLNRKEA